MGGGALSPETACARKALTQVARDLGWSILAARPPIANDRIGNPALASRLRKSLRGDVLFDAFDRGRYSTDASIYQIEPIGVALPMGTEDVEAAIAIAREQGFPVIPRGGGSSQNGQTLGEAVVMDTSRHMNRVLEVDTVAGRAGVQAGVGRGGRKRQVEK